MKYPIKLLACAIICTASSLFCLPGDLDTTFNHPNGFVTISIPNATDVAIKSIALQPNGAIVAAGSAEINSQYKPLLVRFTKDGSLDTSFGANGFITVPIPNATFAEITAIATQPDTIVATVMAKINSQDQLFLVRFTKDGSLDTSFGVSGFIAIQIPNAALLQFEFIAPQSDGTIVGGKALINNEGKRFLARFTKDGSLDTSFGSNGIIDIQTPKILNASYSELQCIALQPDGSIIAGGHVQINKKLQNLVTRFTKDGLLDKSFGKDGIVITPIPNSSFVSTTSIATQPDGAIIVGGYAKINGSDKYVIAKYTSKGELNKSFGGEGIVISALGKDNLALSIQLQADGKIVASGLSDGREIIARYKNKFESKPGISIGSNVNFNWE